jgi:hypothetical protein
VLLMQIPIPNSPIGDSCNSFLKSASVFISARVCAGTNRADVVGSHNEESIVTFSIGSCEQAAQGAEFDETPEESNRITIESLGRHSTLLYVHTA